MSGDLQRVELTEDALEPELDGRPTQSSAGAPRRSRRGLVWLGAGAALIGAGLVAGQAVLDARERAAVAALQEVPGVVAPLGDALSVAYELPSLSWLDLADDGRRAFLVTPGDDSTPHLQAWDLDAGTVLWDARVGSSTSPEAGENMRCSTGTADEGAVVVCLDSDGGTVWDDDGRYSWHEATYARLVVHAQDDGRQVAAWDVDERAEEIAVLDGVVATAGRDRTGVVLTARDLATGEQRWQRSLPETGEVDEGSYFPASVSSAGGVFVASTADGYVQLVRADGSVLPLESSRGWNAPDRDVVVVDLPNDADGSRTALVRDGAIGPELRGDMAPGLVDDGSLGDVVFTTADGLTAWDAASGTRRWSVDPDEPVATYDMVQVVRGTVYALGASGLAAFDGSTGEKRWVHERPDDESYSGGVLTDGVRLYLTELREPVDGQAPEPPVVHALTFDGTPAGEVTVPDGVDWMTTFGDRIWGSRTAETGVNDLVVLR